MLGFARAASARDRASVPRHIGLIEPWIGFALAASTGWMYVLTLGRHIMAAYVLGALAVALWAWRRPARQQPALMARALLFALMGLAMTWLQAGSISSNTTGFFWISVPVIFYALLLRPSYAWALLGVNVLIALSAVAFAGTDLSLMGTVARVGLLLIFTAASIRMGAVLRRTDELLEERRVDAGSGMLNEYGLVDYGGALWSDCRRGDLPATLVFLDVPDLPGLRGLYGSRIARLAVEKTLRLMESLATGRNLVGRLGPSRFALLMPGATRDQALEFLGSRLGHPPQIELDEDDLELIFLLNLHVAESRNQGVTFSRFFEAERGMLDFYFSDAGGSGDIPPAEPRVPDAGPASVSAAPARTPLAAPVLSPRFTDLPPPPSTLPMEPG